VAEAALDRRAADGVFFQLNVVTVRLPAQRERHSRLRGRRRVFRLNVVTRPAARAARTPL
jgi:transcriptional regulator of aromatic amino acid metabolism